MWDSFTESLLKIGFGRESRLPALQSMKGMFATWLSCLRKIKLNKVRCSSKGGSDGVCQSNQILFYYFSYKYRVILSFNQVHPVWKKIKMNTFVGVMFCSRNHIWNFVWKNDYCNGLGPDKIRKSNVDNTTNDEKG